MRKKIIRFIGVLSITMAFFLTGCGNNSSNNDVENNETGTSYSVIIESSEYTLSIKSSELGHPSNGSVFSTYVDIDDKIYDGKKYSVSYDVSYYDLKEVNPRVDYSDFDTYPEVKINDKVFKYTIDSSTINLIYQPSNMDCYLLIKVSVFSCYDDNGNSFNGTFNISVDDLLLDKVKGTINFEIEKK